MWCQSAWHLISASLAPARFLCSSENVEGTLSRVGEAWACSMLVRSCVTTHSALSQSISPAESCVVKLELSDGQATFRSLRSDLITRIASHLQNNLVCIKVPGQYNRKMKVRLYGCWSQPKQCRYDLVLLLVVFSFPLPFHFYSYVCSAPWRMVSRFITWLCINNIRISAEWVNLILKLNI